MNIVLSQFLLFVSDVTALSQIYLLFLCFMNFIDARYYYYTIHTLDVNNAMRYYLVMIISFKEKETEKIWNQVYSKKLPRNIQSIGLRKLIILHKAKDLNDLRVSPGNRLELLSGNREGQHSIRINNQWRICFHWNQGQIIDVEIVDYH